MEGKYNPEIHKRRSIRLREYDYTQAGAYFVTICSWEKGCIFGEVSDGKIELNEYGRILEKEWLKTKIVRRNIDLDVFVIMPNHLHGILIINNVLIVNNVGATRWVALNDRTQDNSRVHSNNKAPGNNLIGLCTQTPGNNTTHLNNHKTKTKGRATHRVAPTAGSIGAIIGQFKSIVTKQINRMRDTQGHPVWQRNYYERIIRDDGEMKAIRDYIMNNPLQWQEDENYPNNINEFVISQKTDGFVKRAISKARKF